MQFRIRVLSLGAEPEQEEARRHVLPVVREILATHRGVLDDAHAIFAERGAGDGEEVLDQRRIVVGDGVALFVVDLCGAAHGRRGPVDDLDEALAGCHSRLGAERADRAGEPDGLGDDVVGRPGVKLRHRDHDRIQGIDAPRGDRLHGGDDVGGGEDRIASEVRVCGVGLSASHDDLEIVGGGEQGSRARGDVAQGQVGPSVQAEDPRHRRADATASLAQQHTLVAHHLSPPTTLLGRLEDERHRVGPIRHAAERPRGADEDGRVPVVPAGVHDAGVGRDVGL